jgi:hypothetical protein
MSDREKIFDAFRNCITEPKCKDCPWEQCEQFNQKKVSIPVTLALDVLNLLKEQEAQRDYEASVEMAEYCERYEQTYNPEDGSM